MEKVIVTGASGFIGRYLVEKLIISGYVVYAVVRDRRKMVDFEENNNVVIVECNLDSIDKLLLLKKDGKFKFFFHLAWDGTSGRYREDYNMQIDNIGYTCRAVEIAKELGCYKFIYSGSLMEYESVKFIQQSGSKPVANYIYRTAKLSAHYMAKVVAVKNDIVFNVGIVSNAYGIGENSPRLINTTIRKLLNGEKTEFTPAEQLYDFIYVTDVAKAFLLIAEEGKDYGCYYIGNKKPKKLKTFLNELKNCVDRKIELGIGCIPFDGVSLEYNEFDTESLYNDTSFTCEVNFEEGIKKTIEWIKREEKV